MTLILLSIVFANEKVLSIEYVLIFIDFIYEPIFLWDDNIIEKFVKRFSSWEINDRIEIQTQGNIFTFV